MSYSRTGWLSMLLLTLLTFAAPAYSQTAGASIRERQRAMDDYDRDINRMKNDAVATRDRRRSLFPQINDDFQRMQVIHNEIVRMFQSNKGLDYGRLADLTGDMKKRGTRLRENLALPQGEQPNSQAKHTDAIDDQQVRKDIGALHDLVVSFVGSPLFKNLGVVDAKVIDQASDNLNHIIDLSEAIKKAAKLLDKKAASPQSRP
ncbi:MAG TPA: hypothetical protein VGK82_03980 [Pyrinomonadaceae bacterium]